MTRTLALITVFMAILLSASAFHSRPTLSLLQPFQSSFIKAVEADLDRDGTISTEEFIVLLLKLDANSDGKVTRCEYVNYWRDNANDKKEAAVLSFDTYDPNNDNVIDSTDVPLFQTSVFDVDGDGIVSLFEFRRAALIDGFNTQRQMRCRPNYIYALPPKEIKKALAKCN